MGGTRWSGGKWTVQQHIHTRSLETSHNEDLKSMNSNIARIVRMPGLAVLAAAALATPFAPMAFAADAAADAANLATGKQLFEDWGCASCHTLKDAGATGHVGPAFDGDAALTKDFAVSRITNGQGAMPSFGGLMTDKEIDTLADYIVASKAP
jgi:mono/diheme cytochrome c family protein